MVDDGPSLAEQVSYWQFQAEYWKARALKAEGKQPTPRIPEDDTHRRISYIDKTGDLAASRADRTKGNHHAKPKRTNARR